MKEDASVTIGNKNEISHSFNITNIISEITTQLSIIKREFNEGNIARAFSDIEDAKKEHHSNEKARYHFLMLETQFYFTLGKYEKVREEISYIEETLSKYCDEPFFEIKASLLALDGDKEEFDQVVRKLIKEFSGYQNPKEYFDLIFLLNSRKAEEAKIVYEDYISKYSDVSKKIGMSPIK